MRTRTAVRMIVGSVTFTALVAGAGLVAGPAGASHSSKSASAKTLTALAKKIKAGKKSTYQAVYSYKATGSTKVSTITVAQKPPKSLFKQSTTHSYLIDTGTSSLECSLTTTTTSSSTTGSTPTSSSTSTSATGTTTTSTTTTTAPKSQYVCVKTGSSGVGAAAGIFDLFDPTTALTYFNTAEQSLIAHIAGYSVKITSGSYGGVSSKCVTLHVSGQSYKYCVGTNGMLTYSGTPGKGYFELKSYTKNVPASDFQPPAGAKTETIP